MNTMLRFPHQCLQNPDAVIIVWVLRIHFCVHEAKVYMLLKSVAALPAPPPLEKAHSGIDSSFTEKAAHP